MAKDFLEELKRYRLDYILSDSQLPSNIINQLGDVELVFKSNNIFIYKLN